MSSRTTAALDHHAARRPEIPRRRAGAGAGLRRLASSAGRRAIRSGRDAGARPRTWPRADDRTIVFRLKRPFPLLPDALGKAGAAVLLHHAGAAGAAPTPSKQVTEIVGSGPFRFKADERVPGSRFVYERFADYVPRERRHAELDRRAQGVHFDRVEWRVMPDAVTAAAALQTGEMDWWERPTADLLPLLRRNRDIDARHAEPDRRCSAWAASTTCTRRSTIRRSAARCWGRSTRRTS